MMNLYRWLNIFPMLVIDSDKHQNKSEKQEERAANFRETKRDGHAYVLKRSCLENYYHPRTFERVYNLPENSFSSIDEEENARSVIKQYLTAKRGDETPWVWALLGIVYGSFAAILFFTLRIYTEVKNKTN
jgi:hypothetical protein